MAYRILSLDGGGAWALIQVCALTKLYGDDARGHDILRDFDMVAANSGGSLVLAGLVEDLSLRDLRSYFLDVAKRKSIFSPSRSILNRLIHRLIGVGPKYSADSKLPALQALLPRRGNLRLPQAVEGIRRPGGAGDLRLLIVGFDLLRNRAAFFRSRPTTGPNWGQGSASAVTLAEAVHASTNAPVNYFDGPASVAIENLFPDGRCDFWDGGLTGCNNPVLAAVTEAIGSGQQPNDIVALSIGTGTVALPGPTAQDPADSPYVRPARKKGLVADLRKVATCILDDPPDAATFLAHVMTGSASGGLPPGVQSRIVRMNPLISPRGAPGAWQPPGAPLVAGASTQAMTPEQFSYLVNLDMDAVEDTEVAAIAAFAELWIDGGVSNQPVRMDSDTLEPELGASSFPGAVEAWSLVREL